MGKGLYIDFEIKRPNRVNRYMDYVAMLGVVIIAAVIIIYLPYIANVKKENTARVEYNTAYSTLQVLENSRVEVSSTTTVYDKNYEISYTVIGDSLLPYDDYITSLLQFIGSFDGGTMSINGVTFNDTNKTLTMTVTDNSGQNRMTSFINALKEDKTPQYTYNTDGTIASTTQNPLSWIKTVDYDFANTTAEVTITYGK